MTDVHAQECIIILYVLHNMVYPGRIESTDHDTP